MYSGLVVWELNVPTTIVVVKSQLIIPSTLPEMRAVGLSLLDGTLINNSHW